MNKELLELIKENPDLQVYAYVDGEVCGDDCGYWIGQFGGARIREFAKVPPYGLNDTDIVYKDEQVDYIEYLMENNIDETLDNEELEKCAKRITENLEYKKAIFVYVELPKY